MGQYVSDSQNQGKIVSILLQKMTNLKPVLLSHDDDCTQQYKSGGSAETMPVVLGEIIHNRGKTIIPHVEIQMDEGKSWGMKRVTHSGRKHRLFKSERFFCVIQAIFALTRCDVYA